MLSCYEHDVDMNLLSPKRVKELMLLPFIVCVVMICEVNDSMRATYTTRTNERKREKDEKRI